mgnify:CR=1 FL=1
MRQFYVSDPALFDITIKPLDFMIYEYFCRNYDLKRLKAYVRMIDCADRFKIRLDQVKNSLDVLSRTSIDFKPLITHKDFTYFEMPRYKYFLERIQFRKNYSSKGWKETQRQVKTTLNGVYE